MDDLISRQAIIQAMYEAFEVDSDEQKWDSGCWVRYKMFERVVESIPPAQKRGKWEPHPTEADWDVCTACGCGTMRRTHGYHNGAFWDAEESYAYCPWCGARMEAE